MNFREACDAVLEDLEKEWKGAGELERMERLESEKRAILGYPEDMENYKRKIGKIIKARNLENAECPPWYLNIREGIFNELYGLSGLAPWVYDETEAYKGSSSAKLIGDRLYCLIDGISVLQPQRIPQERREQLKRTFLMAAPRERLEEGFHEVYLRNGIRITIFSGERTRPGKDVMVLRKYILREMSFGELVRLGTIPYKADELFRLLVKTGINVIFAGPVRSGKTTFLQIWQSYEDPGLEGVAIATDPETDWEKIMPGAPVMQLICDGRELEGITKPLLRGDNDYALIEEMRDAEAFNIALELASIGTGRCKATVHTGNAADLPYTMAEKIRHKYGGNTQDIIRKITDSFDLVFEFRQLEADRSVKLLTGITQYYTDSKTGRPMTLRMMEYDMRKKTWIWHSTMSEKMIRKLSAYPEENKQITRILKELEDGG